MDALLIGTLCAASVAAAMLYWTLLVRPQLFLSALFEKKDEGFGLGLAWSEPDPVTLRAVRWVSGIALLLVTFTCGAITTFLLST